MTQNDKRSRSKRIYGLLKPDWLFGLVFLISIVMLIVENIDPEPIIELDPVLKIAILAGLTLAATFAVTIGAALDRRKTEDYFFQMITNGAFVGIVATMLVNFVWDILYGPLLGDDLIAVMLASWSLGYFFYRARGFSV